MFRSVAITTTCAVSLAACIPQPTTDQIRASIPKVCAGLYTVDAAFQIFAVTGKLKPSLVSKEQAAMRGVDQFCADPDAITDVTSAALALARAYAAVAAALATAQGGA